MPRLFFNSLTLSLCDRYPFGSQFSLLYRFSPAPPHTHYMVPHPHGLAKNGQKKLDQRREWKTHKSICLKVKEGQIASKFVEETDKDFLSTELFISLSSFSCS